MTNGPLGFPCPDKVAFAIDAIMKALPKDPVYQYRKSVIEKAPTELLPGERSDVSWISTEDPDRGGDVVLAKGMNDSQFKQNPIVTMNHCYWTPPVGRSLWRKHTKDGDLRGIKAKTQYPVRPKDWTEGKDWPADVAFTLVQADLLRGKSIGFLPTKARIPTAKELEAPGWQKVQVVIEEWILLEYACVFLPAQQNAVVESVSKGLNIPEEIQRALGIETKSAPGGSLPSGTGVPPVHDVIPFTSLSEIDNALRRSIDEIDAEKIAKACIDRLRGRV